LVSNDDYKIHPAVLRTSKQIYSKARPILYNQDKPHVTIENVLEGSVHPGSSARAPSIIHTRLGPVNPMSSTWALNIVHPGCRFSFHQKMPCHMHASMLGRFFTCSAMGMMRAMKTLTVNLNLVTPQDRELAPLSRACDAVAALCLSLTGISKLEELTIKLSFDRSLSDEDLARLL
jgi:hypothetical protein